MTSTVFTDEDVIHDAAIGLDPLLGRHDEVLPTEMDLTVKSSLVPPLPDAACAGDDEVHGEGLHQEQNDNGEGHQPAHGHHQTPPTGWSIRRSPSHGSSVVVEIHAPLLRCPNPRMTGSLCHG